MSGARRGPRNLRERSSRRSDRSQPRARSHRYHDRRADAQAPRQRGAARTRRRCPTWDAARASAASGRYRCPIGAWSLATLFDALEAAGSARFTPASDLAIGVGLAGGLVALASGWAEWSDTKGDPQRLGLVHATLNEIAFALYATSLVLRLRKQRGAGLATAFAGYAFVSISAYLGGELSFGMRLGTKHTNEPLAPPGDFTPVLLVAELNGAPVKVELDGIPLLISRNAKGDVSAIPAICTHRGGPLENGTFADGCVTCPWHHAKFSLENGCVKRGPAVFSLAQFEARVRDGNVEVRAYRFA